MPLSTARPSNGQITKTVTGQYLAKATHGYSPWRRAEDASRWLRGELQIKPTIKLAADVFGVSCLLVTQARKRLEERDRGK